MKRPLRPDEVRLWAAVAATVRPAPGRAAPDPPVQAPSPALATHPGPPPSPRPKKSAPAPAKRPPPPPPPPAGPDHIEPRRRHRIVRERDPIDARLDLHGLDQDRARRTLEAFVIRAWEGGARAVLVITGKGTLGDGVLRRYVPEWLSDPRLRPYVAGLSQAHRRHGGEGALYVALKRRPPP